MGPDLAGGIALGLEQLAEAVLAFLVIFEDRMDARRRWRPFAVETLGDRGFLLLVRAVIAEIDDVAEAVLFEAPRRVLDDLLERVLRDRNRAGKAHMCGRRVDPAFRDIGQYRREPCVSERR